MSMPLQTSRTSDTSFAIALVLGSMLAFAIMDGLAKQLTATIAIPQIMWIRNIVLVVVAVALLRRERPGESLRDLSISKRPGLQFARSLLLVVESAAFMLAFRYMPIADVHAVAAAAPLMVVALSVPILGEHVGPRRWAAVLIGFLGVLLIVRPGAGIAGLPMLIALSGAALWAIYQVMVRLVARHDSAATTSLWNAIVGLGVTCVIGPLYWTWPSPLEWLLLIIVAILGSGAHVSLITALGKAEASTLQPFTYTLFVWAIVVGYLMFTDFPDLWTCVGAAIIIASGLYIWYRERVRSVASSPKPSAASRPT